MKAWELRERRKKASITQTQLGLMIGMTMQTIGLYERGSQAIPRAVDIALDTVLTDLEDGRIRAPRYAGPDREPTRNPIAAAIRRWVNVHL